MKNKIYRQGDVLIERIPKLPSKLTKQEPENGRIVLAHGEVTGHSHTLDIDAADWWKDDKGGQYLDVVSPTEVVHQEHGAIALTPGIYRVLRQREYSPEAIRNVAD